MTREEADQILQSVLDKRIAELATSIREKPFGIQSVTLDLSTAQLETKPYEIRFPFKSFFVVDATDTNANANIRIGGRESLQSPVPIKKNSNFSADIQQTSAYIHWDAQASKTLTILFFVNATFSTNSVIVTSSGGVAIADGTSATSALVAGTAAAVATLFAADTTRKKGTIQNQTGGSIWIGSTSSVNNTAGNANKGIEILAGQDYNWNNTAALYAYVEVTGDLTTISQF